MAAVQRAGDACDDVGRDVMLGQTPHHRVDTSAPKQRYVRMYV